MVMGLLEVTINEHKETLDHDNPRDFIDGMLINIDRLVEELNYHIIRLEFRGIPNEEINFL